MISTLVRFAKRRASLVAAGAALPAIVFAVSVYPDGLAVSKPSNSGSQSYSFGVSGLTNGQTYWREILCEGQVTSCSSPTGQQFTASGGGATIVVNFSTLAPGTARVRLKVYGGSPSTSDSGWVNVTVVAPYAVAVTPDNGTAATRTANTSGYSEAFTVQNLGSNANTFSFSCSGTGGVTCGTVPGSVSPAPNGGTSVVNMPYSVGGPGTGTLTLTANGTSASDQGSYSVPIVSYGVNVTPDAQVTPTRFSGTAYSETFTVQNTGSASNTYSFSCAATGGISCGTAPANVTLGAGAQTTVSMLYTAVTAGTGTLTLTATGTNATNPGSFTIPVAALLSSVDMTNGLSLDSRYLLQVTATTYDAGGRITQVTDARNQVINYQYDANQCYGALTKVTRVHDASGTLDLVTDIACNQTGFVSSIKDEAGTFRYFFYDTYGRLDSLQNHNHARVKAYGYSYSRTSPNWTFNAASPNAVVESTFVQHTPTMKAVVSTGYVDGLGRPIQTVVQDGTNYHVSATQYDLMGRTWRAWKPYTRATVAYDPLFATNATSFYNAYHSPSTTVPYVETTYRPDPLGRVKQVTPEYLVGSASAVVVHGYDLDVVNKLQITQITDEALKKTRSFTDLFGNAVRSVIGAGAPESTVTQFSYNVVGQRVQATDPRNLNTTFAIDTRGLLTARTSPDAGVVSYKYDKAGNLRFSQDANQGVAGQVYFTTYDFAGRPLVSGQAAAAFGALDPDLSQAFESDTSTWLVVRAYDAKPSPSALTWDRFSAQITPLTLANVSGRLAAVGSKSTGARQVTLFSYDADGQVAARYTYTQANGGGSVLTALNTTVSYFRDLRGALTKRDLVVGPATFYHWYEYDGRGLLSKTYASTATTQPTSPDVTDTYRPSGQPETYQFQQSQGTPLTVPIRYTIRGQTEKVGDPATATYPFSARYVYNVNGTVSQGEFYSAGSPATWRRYRYDFPTYDALNRLKVADYTPWNGTSWAPTLAYDVTGMNYDAAGNVTALQRYRETGTLIDNLTYNYPGTSNRLSSVTDAISGNSETWDARTGSFTYDPNGNLLTAPSVPYSIASAITYNHQDLPVSLTSGANTASYRYDDGGQRITKQVNAGNTEVYIRDGATTLGVFTVNTSGTPVSSYFNILRENRVVGRQTTLPLATRTYDHADILGSTRAVVLSTTGAVVESYDFDPWGLLMPGRTLSSTTPTKEGFSAKEQDTETGLAYFGARYYMAALGRWASTDPRSQDYPAWSPYNYVFNNPNAMVDPLGLDPYIVDCTGDKDCQKHSNQFETARQQALQSKDPDVQRAAQAYGDPGVDNGVVVKFGQPKDPNSRGETHLEVLPTGPNQGPKGRYNVVIDPTAAGQVEVVAHEGVHVANAQAFAATMSNDWSWWDQNKNLTQYDDELSAFRVTNTVLSEANRTNNFPCAGSQCVLGKGVRNPDPVINQILADPNGPYKGITPTQKGPRIYGVSAPPSPTPP